MARTKFGSIITDIRGSVGGHTFTNGSSGTFMRTKVKPITRYSDRVMAQRACMLKLAYTWSTIVGTDLQSWFDKAPLYSFTNSLGKSYTISPYALFQALNTPLVLAGKEPLRILGAPFTKDLSPYTITVGADGSSDFHSTVDSGQYDLFMIFASQIFSRGSRVANIKWVWCEALDHFNSGQTHLSGLTSYLVQQGWRDGSKVQIEFRFSQTDVMFAPNVKSFQFTLAAD